MSKGIFEFEMTKVSGEPYHSENRVLIFVQADDVVTAIQCLPPAPEGGGWTGAVTHDGDA